MTAIQRHNRFQLAQFGLRLQPVTGLDLDRRRAMRQHPIQTRARRRDQRLHRGRPRRSHRRHDPAAGGHDLHVRRAGNPALELRRAIPHPDQMGVRIHEAGAEHLAGDIHLAGGAEGRAQLSRLSHRQDAPVFDRQRAVLDQAQIPQADTALRSARVRRHRAQLRRRM